MTDKFNLARFIEAQENAYLIALRELQEGHKQSHWIWYIFPQLKHLGYSRNSKFYGISGTAEVAAYLENPVLSQRLREVSTTIVNLPTDDAVEVFGEIDARKLCSSMTLFDTVSPGDIFARVLDKYFRGRRDGKTLEIIKREEE